MYGTIILNVFKSFEDPKVKTVVINYDPKNCRASAVTSRFPIAEGTVDVLASPELEEKLDWIKFWGTNFTQVYEN